MKVLIYGDKTPHTIDCSIAFHGFEELDAEIVISQNWLGMNKQEFECYDVCVGGVDLCRYALQKMRMSFVDVPCYPEQLKDFLKREIQVIELKDIVLSIPSNKFFKPVKPKRFNAFKSDDKFDLMNLMNLDEHEKIYACDLIKFLSEWRVYVCKKKIQAICNYSGDPTLFPNVVEIKKMIDSWENSPCCYGLDVGIIKTENIYVHGTNLVGTSNETVLVEVNDFYSIGNYGVYPRDYATMLLMRWRELLKL